MRKSMSVFVFIIAIFLMSGGGAAAQELPEPSIAYFSLEQADKNLQMHLSFRNLVGGIQQAIVGYWVVITYRGKTIAVAEKKKISPEALLTVVNYQKNDKMDGLAIVALEFDFVTLLDNMAIEIGLILTDELGRSTELSIASIVYKKPIKA